MIDWITDLLADAIVQEWSRTVGIAAAVALAIHILGAFGGASGGKAAAAAALALGFFAGHATVAGIPPLPPTERWQWSAWIAAATLLLLFVEEPKGPQATLRFVLELGLVGALIFWILAPSTTARAWSERAQTLVFFGGGIVAVLLLTLLELRAATAPAWRVLLALVLAAAGATAVIALQMDKGARTMAALAAALGASLLLAVVQRGTTLPRTAVAAATLAFGSLLTYAWAAHCVPPIPALLLLLAWLSAFFPIDAGRPWRCAALSFLAAALPAGTAFFLAHRA